MLNMTKSELEARVNELESHKAVLIANLQEARPELSLYQIGELLKPIETCLWDRF